MDRLRPNWNRRCRAYRSDQASPENRANNSVGADFPLWRCRTGRNPTDQSVWMVVSYLNSLNDTGDADLPGNATTGMQLFNGRGNCTGCHMVGGQGGRRGPDLTYVGNRREPDELVSDLRRPSEEVEPRWWTMRATREDGSVVEGLRMNEDTFTFRLMDEQEDLWSFSKNRLRSGL